MLVRRWINARGQCRRFGPTATASPSGWKLRVSTPAHGWSCDAKRTGQSGRRWTPVRRARPERRRRLAGAVPPRLCAACPRDAAARTPPRARRLFSVAARFISDACRQPAGSANLPGVRHFSKAFKSRQMDARSSVFRITIALDGHADVNSTDRCTPAGTSARVMRSKPNLGK